MAQPHLSAAVAQGLFRVRDDVAVDRLSLSNLSWSFSFEDKHFGFGSFGNMELLFKIFIF